MLKIRTYQVRDGREVTAMVSLPALVLAWLFYLVVKVPLALVFIFTVLAWEAARLAFRMAFPRKPEPAR